MVNRAEYSDKFRQGAVIRYRESRVRPGLVWLECDMSSRSVLPSQAQAQRPDAGAFSCDTLTASPGS